MEKPYSSLVVTKSLPEMGLNDWDYEAPSQPLPFAGVDIRNSIIAGKHWAPEEAEHDAVSDPSCQREEQGAEHHAVSDPSCQREAGCMPPPGLDFHTNPTIFSRCHELIDPNKLGDAAEPYTKAWYLQSLDSLPTSRPSRLPGSTWKRTSSWQLSLMFMNMGNMGRLSHVENKLGKKTLKDRRLSILRDLWGQNWAHVTMCAEASELPQDRDVLMENYGFVGKHSEEEKDLAVHARVGPGGFVKLLWEDLNQTCPEPGKPAKYNGHAAIFEVDFGKNDTDECESLALLDSANCAAKARFEDRRQDSFTKDGLLYHAGLHSVRCCVVHINNDCARRRTGVAKQFFWNILQKALDFQVDVIAGDGNAACYSFRNNQVHFDIPNATIPALLRKMAEVMQWVG